MATKRSAKRERKGAAGRTGKPAAAKASRKPAKKERSKAPRTAKRTKKPVAERVARKVPGESGVPLVAHAVLKRLKKAKKAEEEGAEEVKEEAKEEVGEDREKAAKEEARKEGEEKKEDAGEKEEEGEGKPEAVAKLVKGAREEPPRSDLWLEIRPFVGQELRAANLLDLVNVASGSGGTFEFVIAAGPDPSAMEGTEARRVVRYFVKCPDLNTVELAKNVLQASGFAAEKRSMSFEEGKLVWSDALIEYPLEAELQLAIPYAKRPLFPETPTYERTFEQFVDTPKSIHAAVLSGGALRFVFRRDDRAARYLKAPGSSASGMGEIGRSATEFGSLFFRNLARGAKPDGYEGTQRPTPVVDQRALQEFTKRVQQTWFVCDARAYGTPEQIRAIVNALTFPSNQIVPYRIRRASGRPPHSNGSWIGLGYAGGDEPSKEREGKPADGDPKQSPGRALRAFFANLPRRLGGALSAGLSRALGRAADFFSGHRIDPSLQELRGWIRKFIIFLPPLLLFVCWATGAWSPSLGSTPDQALIASALILPPVIKAAWRMRKTIALGLGELVLLLSLPSKPEAGHFYFAEARTPTEIREVKK